MTTIKIPVFLHVHGEEAEHYLGTHWLDKHEPYTIEVLVADVNDALSHTAFALSYEGDKTDVYEAKA